MAINAASDPLVGGPQKLICAFRIAGGVVVVVGVVGMLIVGFRWTRRQV